MKRATLLLFSLALLAVSAFASPPAEAASAGFEVPNTLVIGLAAFVGITATMRLFGVSIRHSVVSSTVITTTLLNQAYGTVYKDGSKSQKDLRQQLYHTATFDQLFKVEYTKLTTWERAMSSSSRIVQAAQIGWTPTGEVTFTPSVIDTYAIKVDLEFSSYDVEDSFVGFMHENNVPQTGQELVKYIMDNHVKDQFVEDIELNLSWRGVRVNPNPNTPGTATGGINGVYTVLNNAIEDDTIVPLAVGAAPTGNETYTEYIEDFVEKIPILYRYKPMKLAVSVADCNRFEKGMMDKYQQNYKMTNELRKVMRYENIELVPQVAMANSRKVVCTVADNAIKVVNLGRGQLWNFEVVDRKVKIFTNQRLGYGYWNHQAVFTNDVELTPQS